MIILVSECLLGVNCKYNGGNNLSQKVLDLKNEHTLIPVCPEVLGGLTIPRTPIELKNGLPISKDGNDMTKECELGLKRGLKIALDNKVQVAILQSRSPTCGVNEIYDGTFTGNKIKGQGLFCKLLRENGIRAIDVLDFDKSMLK